MQDLNNAHRHSFAPDQGPGPWFLAQQELTAREREVWTLMVRGYSDTAIAQRLAVNNLTVRFHVSNLLVKLGASERQEAVTLAEQHDLMPVELGS